jgi:hypothetical protein
MSSHSNEYDYAKEFIGNFRSESKPVPVQVTTRLRLMSKPPSTEIRRYDRQLFDKAPQYVFGGGSLPLHPSLQAVGRHYFTW